jgi:8-oxo-dGTP diphosphatase
MVVDFQDLDDSLCFQFSVILAKDKNGFVYVQHQDRDTWEIPGGHIEAGETALEAAHRELKEETGALDYELQVVCDYSVNIDNTITYGRIFFAEIKRYSGSLDFEIDQVHSFGKMPDNLTYPLIQPLLFQEVLSRIPEKMANVII